MFQALGFSKYPQGHYGSQEQPNTPGRKQAMEYSYNVNPFTLIFCKEKIRFFFPR